MTMPAGKYWVGDLCYVMHDEWDEVCGRFFAGRNDHGCNEGEFNLADGRRFVSFNTKWGDGGYRDQFGNTYGVDAGLIGCIKISDIYEIQISNDFTGPIAGGHVIDFPHDFICSGGRSSRDWDGVIRIGDVCVDTDPEEGYEDEEDEYECEECDE